LQKQRLLQSDPHIHKLLQKEDYVTPGSGYVDQDPQALRLTLVNGRLDTTPFHVFARQELRLAGIQVQATIIGASHIMRFEAGPLTLHEIFACTELEGVSSWPLKALMAESVQCRFPGFSYDFSVACMPWSDPEPSDLQKLAETAHNQKEDSLRLIQEFPQDDEIVVTPKTVIVGSADDDGKRVVVTTAHSYPKARGLVISQSALTHQGGVCSA
jgi:hypothetical protein